MIPFTDLHIHTDFSDGSSAPEEMVLTAIKKGLSSIGFSDHSPVSYEDYAIPEEKLPDYKAEIRSLKEKYRGRIKIFLGIENDSSEPVPTQDFDYVIGSVHAVPTDAGFCAVDYKELDTCIDAYGGEAADFIRAYYYEVVKMARGMRPDIIGHFDLLVKLNRSGRYFDENSTFYRETALDALRKTAQYCNLFEINTGGMSRGYRDTPYPAGFLIRELKRLGCNIILASDAHAPSDIAHAFGPAAELAKECGFKYASALTENGFVQIKL